jgi:hypothetical protein
MTNKEAHMPKVWLVTVPALLPEYEPSVGTVIKALNSLWRNENGDPAKIAQVILRLASSDRLPAHLLIGSDAVQYASEAEANRKAEAERWHEVSVSTDFGAPAPAAESRS